MFSNEVRKEAGIADLSFMQIVRIVGDRWQSLKPWSKEVYENRALREKEKYNQQLSAYKSTGLYRAYQAYLADFKAKQDNEAGQDRDQTPRPPLADSKRARGSGVAHSLAFDDGYAANLKEEEAMLLRAAETSLKPHWTKDKLQAMSDKVNRIGEDIRQEDRMLRETEDDNPFTRRKASSKAFQHAQSGSIVPHYTISRDFSGCNNDVVTSILSYLGEREKRRGDLSVLVRR
jgi:hypothetical protein